MNNEEILIRLGLDGGPMSQNLGKARQEVNNFGGEASKGFGRGRDGAREMRRAMKDLAQESPLAAIAMKAAFAPIGAAIGGALLILKTFKAALAELNARFDETGKAAAKGFGSWKETLEEVRKKTAKMNEESDKWVASHFNAIEHITEALKRQLEVMQSQDRIADKLLDKEKDRAVAAIRAQVKSGKMTKEKGASEEGLIGTAYEQELKIREYGRIQAELKAREKASREAVAAGKTAGTQITADEAELKKSKFHADSMAKLEKERSDLVAAQQKNTDWIDELKDPTNLKTLSKTIAPVLRGGAPTTLFNVEWASAHAQQESLTAQQKLIESQMASLKPKLDAGGTTDEQRKARIALNRGIVTKAEAAKKAEDDALFSLGLKRNELLQEMSPEDRAATVRASVARDRLSTFQAATARGATPEQKQAATDAYKAWKEVNQRLPDLSGLKGAAGSSAAQETAAGIKQLTESLVGSNRVAILVEPRLAD